MNSESSQSSPLPQLERPHKPPFIVTMARSQSSPQSSKQHPKKQSQHCKHIKHSSSPLSPLSSSKKHHHQQQQQQQQHKQQVFDNDHNKHKQQPQQQQQQIQQQGQGQGQGDNIPIPQNILICYLCQKLLINSVQSICGHAFCQYCLSQYLLISNKCPICHIRIRQKKSSANKTLDALTQQFCTFLGQNQLKQYKINKEGHKKWKQQRKIQKACAGVLVDIRDQQYVWRVGRVLRTFNRINGEQVRVKFVVVQYLCNSNSGEKDGYGYGYGEGYGDGYGDGQRKEELPVHCLRLAKAGYYTSRDDVPKYKPYHIQDQQYEQKQRQVEVGKFERSKKLKNQQLQQEVEGDKRKSRQIPQKKVKRTIENSNQKQMQQQQSNINKFTQNN